MLVSFLIAELPGLLRHYGLATGAAGPAIVLLAEHQAALGALPRQLVHGDIGPDNVLLDGGQVVAIIGFTPHVLPVLFAASTAHRPTPRSPKPGLANARPVP